MADADDYLKKAKEAEAMAASAIYEDHRQAFLDIADGWRELAEQRARQRGPGATVTLKANCGGSTAG